MSSRIEAFQRCCVAVICFTSMAALSTLAAEDLFNNPKPEDAPRLIRSLADPNVRLGASNALVTLGAEAAPHLRQALESDDMETRIAAAYTLGRLEAKAAQSAPALAGLLTHSDRHLRAIAARSLGQIGSASPSVVEAIVAATRDADPRVREWSVVALGELGAAAPALVQSLKDQRLRAHAIAGLVKIGEPAAPHLVDALDDAAIRQDAAAALREIDGEQAKQVGVARPTEADLDSLRLALLQSDRDVSARIDAAQRLGELGSKATAALLKALGEDDRRVADAAAVGLSRIGATATVGLRASLQSESASVRGAAADALGLIGGQAKDALPELIAALTDQDRGVRHRAVKALKRFGPAALPAAADLIKVMQNPRDQEPTRQMAIKTLAGLAQHGEKERILAAFDESSKDGNYGVSSLVKRFAKSLRMTSYAPPHPSLTRGRIAIERHNRHSRRRRTRFPSTSGPCRRSARTSTYV